MPGKANSAEELQSGVITLESDQTITVRFSIDELLGFYLNEEFQPKILELLASIRAKEYYVNMMIAWYFSTSLAEQYFGKQGRQTA